MVCLCVELSIDMAVLCGVAVNTLTVPIGIRPHRGAVSCASACFHLQLNLSTTVPAIL
jgi:hypothetical protein